MNAATALEAPRLIAPLLPLEPELEPELAEAVAAGVAVATAPIPPVTGPLSVICVAENEPASR